MIWRRNTQLYVYFSSVEEAKDYDWDKYGSGLDRQLNNMSDNLLDIILYLLKYTFKKLKYMMVMQI